MKSKRRFIPLVFLGAIVLSLLVIVPAFSATGTVRFYDVDDTDEDQEWTRQGGMVAIEVEDDDLDVVAELVGDNAETQMLNNVQTFFLNSVPVADRSGDGFINQRDISVIDANDDPVDVDRASVDGRVDLIAPHTGEVRISYHGAVVNNTGVGDDATMTVKSQADPTGIKISLMETSADSGVFQGMVATNGADDGDESDADTSPPTLKVGKNDVIRVTYSDADPDRNTSQTLKVETTAPIISNPSPAHNSADRADPDIEFDVTDSDSGIADADDIYVIFGIDNDEDDGEVDAMYSYMVNDASKGDVDEEDDVFSAKQGLPSEVEIDNDATVYWWAIAIDSAGNVAVTDRQSTIEVDGEDVDDPCNATDFNMGSSLVGSDVGVSAEIAGCQPYAVRIDNTEPEIESVTTGPTWDADDDEVDMDAGEPTSILVTFSEDLDAETVADSDFDVDGASVTDVEVQDNYVFLTLSSELGPDEEPEVELVGSVRDIAGNRQTSGKDDATDGIAPTLTVSVEGGNRSVTNDSIKIMISSNEDVGTPKVMFQKVVDVDAEDNDETADANEAMYALGDSDDVDAVLTSARNYEAKYEAPDSGLYNVYVMARDATESNQGTAGVNEGPIDLDLDDTKAILFEFDDGVGAPVVTPEETDSSGPFISIDFSAEGTEYEDNDGDDLDSHGDVTITSATLESPDMDAMDITDALVTTDNKVFLYKASDLAKGDHVVTVSAMDSAGNELEDEELTVEVVERELFSLKLKPGWNLVSVPGTPTNTSINAVIPADHPANTILSYDAEGGWLTAIRSEDGTWLGTLVTIDSTRAYWIQTDSFEAIKVDIPRISAGTSVPPTIALSAGWNFVPVVDVSGSLNHGDAVSAKAYFSGTEVNRVYSFNTLQGMWEVVDIVATDTDTTDDFLMVGSGYWAHASEDGVLAP